MNKLPDTFTVDDTAYGIRYVTDDYAKWHDKYYEFAQGRTNFQIEKYIAIEDGTLANTYVNTLYQTRVMRSELMKDIKRGIEAQRNFEYIWKDHDQSLPKEIKDAEGNPKLIWYDLEKMEHDHMVAELKMSVKDKLQQLEFFGRILEKFEEMNGKPFTKEQYDAEAPLYWQKRFEKQSIDAVIGARTGISTGDIKSIRQALAPTILDDSPNQITDKNTLIEEMLSGNFDVNKMIADGNESIKELYEALSNPSLEKAKGADKIADHSAPDDDYAVKPNMFENLGITVKKS